MANLKQVRRKSREKLLSSLGVASHTQVRANHREQMYYQAFLDLKSSLGIETAFFPFGGAANSSLLYLLARAVSTLDFSSICEFGAGQSTILLDALANGRRFEAHSFEQRDFWAKEVRSQLKNSEQVQVHYSELLEQAVRGHPARFYDLSAVANQKFDLMVVDGPSGTKRRSRWGSLLAMERLLDSEFLVILDDAERVGEMDTCAEAVKLLEGQGRKIFVETIEASKNQFLIATEKYRAACFF